MAVVVSIRSPGALIDREVGIDGAGGVAGILGFGNDVAQLVDDKVAEHIRDALGSEQVDADVYVSATPPDPSSRSSALFAAGVAVLVGIAIGRLV